LAISRSPTKFTAAPLSRYEFCHFDKEGRATLAMMARMAIATANSRVVKPFLLLFFHLILLPSQNSKLKKHSINLRPFHTLCALKS
jgi:hypothetical protein